VNTEKTEVNNLLQTKKWIGQHRKKRGQQSTANKKVDRSNRKKRGQQSAANKKIGSVNTAKKEVNNLLKTTKWIGQHRKKRGQKSAANKNIGSVNTAKKEVNNLLKTTKWTQRVFGVDRKKRSKINRKKIYAQSGKHRYKGRIQSCSVRIDL